MTHLPQCTSLHWLQFSPATKPLLSAFLLAGAEHVLSTRTKQELSTQLAGQVLTPLVWPDLFPFSILGSKVPQSNGSFPNNDCISPLGDYANMGFTDVPPPSCKDTLRVCLGEEGDIKTGDTKFPRRCNPGGERSFSTWRLFFWFPC